MNQTRPVPSPWTPVEVFENENGILVRVWGREYNFGHEMFPVSITSLGKEMLASPIRLIGEDNGEPIEWADKENWVQKLDDRQVVIHAAQQSRFAVVSAVITIEYDGNISYQLRLATRSQHHRRTGYYAPPDYARRIVNKLWLEIPLMEEHAKLFHSGHHGGTQTAAARTDAFPFDCWHWYGNDELGLAITMDSDEHWNCADKNRAIETLQDEECFLIRHHWLDAQPERWMKEARERTCDDLGIRFTPVHYQFTLQATPIKPFDELLLREHIIHVDCFARINNREYLEYFTSPTSETDPTIVLDRLKEKGVTTLTLHQKWNPIQGFWELGPRASVRIHQLVEEVHNRGMKLIFYFCNTLSTLRDLPEEYFARNGHWTEEHLPMISFYRRPPQRTYRSCVNGPDLWRDFSDGMLSFVQEFDADGVYIDSASIPWGCTNETHGCGYVDVYGNRHPTYPINKMRKCFQYLYEEMHDRLGKSIQLHSYDTFIPGILAYADLYWHGEYAAVIYETNTKGLVASFTDDFIRTELSGRNIGVPCQFLAYNLPDNSWNMKTATAVTAPYGVYPRPIDIHSTLDDMSPIWTALDSFRAADCVFHPYYSDDVGASCDNDQVKIASYTSDSTFVLVVCNPTFDTQQGVTITANNPAVREILSGKVLEGKTFTVDLPPFETLYIECRKS